MIIRGNKSREEYLELQKDYKAYGVKCILGRENGSCFLVYEGYVKGTYSSGNLSKILNCFVDTLGKFPITVSLDLEDKIIDGDESHSLLSAAVKAMNNQRNSLRTLLNQALLRR